MRTALVIIKRSVTILPELAEKAKQCYSVFRKDWTCIINHGEVMFHHKMNCDFLVTRIEPNIKEYATRIAKLEGKCNRVIIANFGDTCCENYSDLIKLNSVGISHSCDEYGEVLEDKSFVQTESFICLSYDEPKPLSIDGQLNIFIGKPATQIDLDHYNLDAK